MFNRGLEELLTQHIKTTQMCLEEIVSLKKKDNELTEQLIRMEGRIELGIEHAEMSNLELQKKIESESGSTFVTKIELTGLTQRLSRERSRDILTGKLLVAAVGFTWAALYWMLNHGVIHV